MIKLVQIFQIKVHAKFFGTKISTLISATKFNEINKNVTLVAKK